jgi:hypothetical protein
MRRLWILGDLPTRSSAALAISHPSDLASEAHLAFHCEEADLDRAMYLKW